MRRFIALAAFAALFVTPPAAFAVAVPIPGAVLGNLPGGLQGSAATAQRLASVTPPQNPFMAPNGLSNIHADGWQTDSYATPGPLGAATSVNSTLRAAECASVTFDSRGRIVSVCVGLLGPQLVLMDPRTLDEIASFSLPARQISGGDLFGVFTDFSGGGYFYLDNQNRVVIPTTTRHVEVIAERTAFLGLATYFSLAHDFDLSGVVAAGDSIISALPDWSGRIWFISTRGVVGTIDPSSGAVHAINTAEGIGNSLAVDETGGVYVVTNAALYRFDADPATGAPQVTWRQAYANSGVQKPGQNEAGSGTTPTVMQGGLVAITDNADPMDVVVMRRDAAPSGSRVVCTVPVFGAGASSTEQSLVAMGSSLVVENNYGYSGLGSVLPGKTTTPGLERIAVDAAHNSCAPVWVNGETSPSAVAKVSLSTGLIYTYTRPADTDPLDAWYLSAIDACTGQTVYRQLAGAGALLNNNFSPITLGPDGDAYVGVLGGLLRFHDETSPQGAPAGATPRC